MAIKNLSKYRQLSLRGDGPTLRPLIYLTVEVGVEWTVGGPISEAPSNHTSWAVASSGSLVKLDHRAFWKLQDDSSRENKMTSTSEKKKPRQNQTSRVLNPQQRQEKEGWWQQQRNSNLSDKPRATPKVFSLKGRGLSPYCFAFSCFFVHHHYRPSPNRALGLLEG